MLQLVKDFSLEQLPPRTLVSDLLQTASLRVPRMRYPGDKNMFDLLGS